MDNITPVCSLCGQKLGPKLIDCPYRPEGGCPFVASVNPPSSTNAGCMVGVLLFVLVWLGGATAGFSSILLGSRSLVSSLLSVGALLIFWAFGLLALAFVLFSLFGKNVALYNPNSGAMARYVTIFGRAFGGGVSSGWEPLPAELSQLGLAKPLHYPASLSAWLYSTEVNSPRELAAYLCQAALLVLVADNALELRRTTTHDTLAGLVNRRSQRYLLTPGEGVTRVDGVLEQKIMAVFAETPLYLQTQAWVPGSPVEINHLIAAIYDQDHLMPEKWLIGLVEDDLLARGLGRREKPQGLSGWFKNRVKLEAADQPQLETDYQVMRTKYNQLHQTQPDFMTAMRADIDQAFKARTESSD